MGRKNPYIKIKTVEASARSWFRRPSEMDKTIARYVEQGWELAEQKQIDNKKRYKLTFHYVMSEAEIATFKKNQRNGNIGCAVLVGLAVLIYALNNRDPQAAQRISQTNPIRQVSTRVAVANPTLIKDKAEASNTPALETATHTFTPTLTLTITPTQTSSPTQLPTASVTGTSGDTPPSSAQLLVLSASNTPAPSGTPVPTETATQIPAVTITNTPRPSPTRQATSTPVPVSSTYYISGGNRVNGRDCPRTSCAIATSFSSGDAIEVVGNVDGENTLGSTQWRQVLYQGSMVYVHSALTSRTRPAPAQPVTVQPSGNGGGSNISTPSQLVSTPLPAQPPVVAAGCDCTAGDTLNCANFNSQSAAQACHNKCMAEVGRDVHGLDGRDQDGLACESLP